MVRPTDLRRRSRFVQLLAFSHASTTSPTRRRLLTISAYFFMWVVLSALAPLWIPIAFVVGIARRRSFVILRLLAFFWLFLATEMVGLLAAGSIYLVTRGDLERRETLFFHLSNWWGSSLFGWICRCLSLTTSVEGEERILPGPLLVFIRHASIIDTALPVTYVFKRELLVDPCIDVAGHAWPNYFIDRAGQPSEELGGIRRLADNLGDQGVLLYPEGTRFTERKKRIAIKRLADAHPELVPLAESFRHSLPPKPGGALTLLDAAPDVDVLVVAHRGLEGLAEVTDLLSGSVVGKRVEIRFSRIAAEDIPEGEARRRWLFELWKRVDDFVETGVWEGAP